MKITSITTTFTAECRLCDKKGEFTISVHPDVLELPLGDSIEVACHEHLEAEGWVDGLCPFCRDMSFLGQSDKDEHDADCEREENL